MAKIMFDSNVFDRMDELSDLFGKHADKYEFYITTIQIEELARISDDKIDIRIENFINLSKIRSQLVPISVFSFANLRFDLLSFGSGGKVYEQIRNQNDSNENDALIADTAVHEGCTLVTGDKDLLRKMQQHEHDAIHVDDFIKQLHD